MKKQIKIIASIVVLALFYVAAISSGSSQNAVQRGTEKALITSGNHNGYDSASGKE